MKMKLMCMLSMPMSLLLACDPSPNASIIDPKKDSIYHSVERIYSKPIPIDSANKMIQSYLASIHPNINQFETKSLIFDADLLRDYLNDSSHGRIANLKMVLAHRLSYINEGHFGQRPDSNSEALTLVLIGYGDNGNYIFYGANEALNICQPCPRECPESGTAANDLLVQ